MDNITIAASKNAPSLEFDFAQNHYRISGTSFMEDTKSFYTEPVSTLEEHLSTLNGTSVKFEFALTYFNSSSARVVFRLFSLLDDVAEKGNDVTIIWHHDDDEDIEEEGEEFAEDLEHATFKSES